MAMFLLYIAYLYAAIGLATAIVFVTIGIAQVGHYSMTPGARILLLPGAMIFWPYIISRWLKSRQIP
ncbi:MAG: hypothetical protein ABI830_01145 [Pseudolabrys sp.]